MVDFKYEPKKGALREIMNSSQVWGLIEQSTNQMGAAADSMGSGKYEYDVIQGKVSPHGMVKTTDMHCRYSNAKHNTLVKCIDEGRV